MKNQIIVLILLAICSVPVYSQASDAALRLVSDRDRNGRDPSGKLQVLSSAEHLSRGQVYFDNRQFPEAREHFKIIFEQYPGDAAVAPALLMTGRSFMWERQYASA